MSNIGSYIRGNTVNFSIVFQDANGNSVNPAGATLTIYYATDVASAQVTIVLTASGQYNWVTTWDSTVALPGEVDCHAETTGGPPTFAFDFEITIQANASND